jgi:hypothetical protein
MALKTQIQYSAQCDDCKNLACSGCFGPDKQRTVNCAVGCGYRVPKDNPKKIYCIGCRDSHMCSNCGSIYETLNEDDICKECENA